MHFFDPPGKPLPASITGEGTIVSWDDDKGFGWIDCKGRRHFAHIKDFDRGQRRPAKGDVVTFASGMDEKDRSCAKAIRFVRRGGSGRMGIGSWIVLAFLLVLPLLASARLPFPWWMGPCWLSTTSLITYGFYSSDKKRAQSGQWRISETRLHLLGILGGWPGAWIAQRRLRHKTVKGSFQLVFWVIILIFQLASADFLMGGRGTRMLATWLTTR